MRGRPLLFAICLALVAILFHPPRLHAQATDTDDGGATADNLRQQAAAALSRGVAFFAAQVATNGGYLWTYSHDLRKREGEGRASATQVWVQPPGTPAVGAAMLDAYDATGDRQYLTAAVAAARCLVRGQLRSGGWPYRIDFDPARRRADAYRDNERDGGRNVTVLDDDTTQSALRLLMRVDRAVAFADEPIHEAVTFALDSLLAAQQPTGAWPQAVIGPADASWPVKPASYPESWPREYPGHNNYWYLPTLNDNLLHDMVGTLLDAVRIYQRADCLAAARRAGEFLIRAQMPEPQPAWAQQYSRDMQPVWARKFEPPAITGGESRTAIRTLLLLYRVTGDPAFLAPVGPALDWYRRSQLPDGRMARFYELRTNKPLYFTKQYELTCDGSDVPTHYAFTVGNPEPSLRREYDRLRAMSTEERRATLRPSPPESSASLEARVRTIIAAQDDRGAWVEDGRLRYHGGGDDTTRIISCRTFVEHVQTLSRYLAATRR